MIPQAFMDFFRDLFVTTLAQINAVLPFDQLAAAGTGFGGAAAATGNILFLLFGPGWSMVLVAFAASIVVYGITAVIALLGRRFTAS